MNILGVNGWFTRSHDASAALISDNRLIAFIEEERLTRHKHAFEQLPHRAIDFCLREANLTLDDIDFFSIGWDYLKKYKLRNIPIPRQANKLIDLYLPRELFTRKVDPKLRIVDHHRAHATAAFQMSGFDESAVMVLDGQGEYCSISLWLAANNELKQILTLPVHSSLGYFYEAVSVYLGFSPLSSGKTMGLSAYGKEVYPITSVVCHEDGFNFKCMSESNYSMGKLDDQELLLGHWRKEFLSNLNFPPAAGSAVLDKCFSVEEANIALSGQTIVEKCVLHLASILKTKSKTNNLCLAGGTALNCCVNTSLVTSGFFQNVHVSPIINDAGVSLGSALHVAMTESNYKTPFEWSVYSGPSYSNEQASNTLSKYKIDHRQIDQPHKTAASLLAQGKILGWFQGKSEMGPRALGNRSILADARISDMRDRVNRIKIRERWRPFAPSVLEEDAKNYFSESWDSPFMLFTYGIKPKYRQLIPAVCHIDNSSRPQTVSKSHNFQFWLLLQEFKKITSISAVLNTSFNDSSEPIVCSPEDAAKMFLRSNLDALIIGNMLATKTSG
jgi:carbamoyltransferase